MLDRFVDIIRKKIQRKRCIDEIVAKTGWKYAEAAFKVDEDITALSISYRDYVRLKYYLLSSEEQEKKKKRVQRNRDKKEEKAIKDVMAITGWSRGYTEEMISDAHKRTGCTFKEYSMYKFYELSFKEQEKVFLIKDSMKLISKYDVNKEFSYILTDKGKTNEYFKEFLKRPWCINTEVSLDEFITVFEGIEKVIYKPIDGNRGKGIKAFDLLGANNIESVYNEIAQYPKGVVEAFVIQHSSMCKLSLNSVNTIRIVSISSNKKNVTKDGKKMDIAYAALRIGGGDSVVDNFHSGGMAAAIDLNTGKIITDAIDLDGNVFSSHPLTRTTIKGFEIPYFVESVKMVQEAINKNKIEGYLGWDIAISETGPVLIEVNVRPGVVLLSMPYISEKKGMKHIMNEYM